MIYILVVDQDPVNREKITEILSKIKNVVHFVTGSILDASVKHLTWTHQGNLPRAVIVDWDLYDDEACITDERDGCKKAGAHFLLSQCAQASEFSLLITYTAHPLQAREALTRSLEGSRVQVVNKNQLSIEDLVAYVESKSFSDANLAI
jgi:CheY-like chemotaxis protein